MARWIGGFSGNRTVRWFKMRKLRCGMPSRSSHHKKPPTHPRPPLQCGPFPWTTAGLILCLLGCGASDPSPSDVSLALSATVATPGGKPISGAVVLAEPWPASQTLPAPVDPLARTNASGRFAVDLGTFRTGDLDSLRIQWLPPSCFEPLRDTTLYQIPRTGDTLAVLLSDTLAALPAAATVGEYCGFGVASVEGPGAFRLGLRVDSVIGLQLYGRWRLNYDWTQGDDYGAFTGGITTSVLVLDLVHDAPWGACTGLRLGAAVSATGDWGPLEALAPQGCVLEPLRFDLVHGHWFNTFP